LNEKSIKLDSITSRQRESVALIVRTGLVRCCLTITSGTHQHHCYIGTTDRSSVATDAGNVDRRSCICCKCCWRL